MKRRTARPSRAWLAPQRARRPNPTATDARHGAAMAAAAHVVRYLRREALSWQERLRAGHDLASLPPKAVGRFVALHDVRAFFTGQRVPSLGGGTPFREFLVDHAGEMSLQAAFARAATVLREGAARSAGDAADTFLAFAEFVQFGRVPTWARES